MAEKPENEADPVISSSRPSHKPGGQQEPAEAPKPEKETKERKSSGGGLPENQSYSSLCALSLPISCCFSSMLFNLDL